MVQAPRWLYLPGVGMYRQDILISNPMLRLNASRKAKHYSR
jgi:hypothetical protein